MTDFCMTELRILTRTSMALGYFYLLVELLDVGPLKLLRAPFLLPRPLRRSIMLKLEDKARQRLLQRHRSPSSVSLLDREELLVPSLRNRGHLYHVRNLLFDDHNSQLQVRDHLWGHRLGKLAFDMEEVRRLPNSDRASWAPETQLAIRIRGLGRHGWRRNPAEVREVHPL